jgi:hypothetical protein
VFFGDRIFPYGGTIEATGNDFIYLYYAYKAYLLDCLAHGTLPLWSPAEGAGYPFYSSPFTQSLYPLNLPLAAFYAVAGGYSSHDHQVFTAVGNALFGLGMYVWLRSLGSSAAASLFGACLVSTSFRFGDILRFPNAVHTALWYPWILLSFNRILSAGRTAELVQWLAALGAFLLCFLTAGYPYYVYYSAFLFTPYLMLAACGVLPGVPPATRRRLGLVAAVASLALASCLPYLAKVKQAMDATVGRTIAADFSWYRFQATDSLNSLVFPIGASPEGACYFGIAGVLLIVLYVAGVARDPGNARGERRLILTLLSWILIVTYISLGEGSYLFELLYRILPGFSRLRIWGRLSIILLPLLGLLLARAFQHFQALLAAPATPRGDPRRRGTSVLLAALVLISAVQAVQVLAGHVHRYYDAYLPGLRGLGAWSLVGGALAFAALGGLVAAAGRRTPLGLPAGVTLAALLLVTVVDVWPVASRLWSTRTVRPRRIPFDVAGVLRRAPGVARRLAYGTISMDFDPSRPEMSFSPSFNISLIPEWYFTRYADFVRRGATEPSERDYLLGRVDGRRLFLSARTDHALIRAFLEDSDTFGGSAAILDYTGDRMEVDVQMPADGFLTFVDNWDPDWRVLVDGRPTPVMTPFGTFKAAAVPAGRHRVLFGYVPRLWPFSSGVLTAQTSTESRVSR